MDSAMIYHCPNKTGCDLGSRGEMGSFTGGMSAEMKERLTGEPKDTLKEGEDFGEGFCPNCGTKGIPTGEEHTSHEGEDPLAEVHKEADASVRSEIDNVNEQHRQGNITPEEHAEAIAALSGQAQETVEDAAKKEAE